MRRLPIRLRLALAFAAAMAVVLAGMGVFVHVRLGNSLLEQIDESLSVRAATLVDLTKQRGADVTPGELDPPDEDGFVQLIDSSGDVVVASRPDVVASLVAPRDLARSVGGPLYLRQDDVPGLDGAEARILVQAVDAGTQSFVLVVGASLEDRQDALDGLVTQLVIIGPIVLLAASLGGYLLAAAALRPVEAMRRRAVEVSAVEVGRRLPLPIARDEIHRLGETLNAMLGRLEEGIARERRFVADASHELRTPLALLQAEFELALGRPRSNDELTAAIRSGSDEVDRLARLAEDLLVLARSDEGALPLHASRLEAGELLSAVARRFGSRAVREGRDLVVETNGVIAFSGDRLRLEQALGNLVDNALRHGAGTVRLRAQVEGDTVALRVTDEGQGFPADLLPHAFERFSRADAARGSGGAGLGLAIVAAISAAHGGTASAANGLKGAVVELALPVDGTSAVPGGG